MVTKAKSGTAKRSQTAKKAKKQPALSIKTYDAAMQFLYSQTDYEQMLRVRYNKDTFNLDRMKKLLKKIGDPHKQIRTIHIAGTKGKGSTATMLASMLESCGYNVGLYVSPHVCSIRERITINKEQITRVKLTQLITQLAPHIEKMKADKPTFFEIMTAIAFKYYADSEVDFAVIETGLGGRLDSTNVIKPLVCGLTSISLDHMHQLGKNISDIAREKAGIFKKNTPVVSVPQDSDAKKVLLKTAKEVQSPIKFTGDDIEFSYRVESSRSEGCHTRVCLTTPTSRFEHLPVPVLGEHQAVNCGLALALLDELKNVGIDIDDEKAVAGLADVALPGRMEVVYDSPRIVVDGAHNGASIKALMRGLGQHIPYDSMVMIFGCASDKDIRGMMSQVATGADKIIFTRVNSGRSSDPQDLAEIYSEISDGRVAQVAPTLRDALNIANNAVSREDIICVTGSFYLVGEAKQLLQNLKSES